MKRTHDNRVYDAVHTVAQGSPHLYPLFLIFN